MPRLFCFALHECRFWYTFGFGLQLQKLTYCLFFFNFLDGILMSFKWIIEGDPSLDL